MELAHTFRDRDEAEPLVPERCPARDAKQLQLEVLISRLEAEYKVEAVLEMAPFDTARWLSGPADALEAFKRISMNNLAKDRDGNPVFMARSAWDVGYQQEKNPELTFSATRER